VNGLLSVVPLLEKALFVLYVLNLVVEVKTLPIVIVLGAGVLISVQVVRDSIRHGQIVVDSDWVAIVGVESAQHILVLLQKHIIARIILALFNLKVHTVLIILLVVAIFVAILLHGGVQVSLQSHSVNELFGKDLRLCFAQFSSSVLSNFLERWPVVFLHQLLRSQIQLFFVISKYAHRRWPNRALIKVLCVVSPSKLFVVRVVILLIFVLIVVILGKEFLVLGELKWAFALRSE
jgi:hypothetical protein